MQKVRVLIVDDSVVFRSQIRSALERCPGIEVVGAANNGKIALQKLEQLSVDVVTLDMEMPEMNGLETIREIKRLKFPVRIVVFSAQTKRGSESALQALSFGADDILAKPESVTPGMGLPADVLAQELTPKVLQFKLGDASLNTLTPNPSFRNEQAVRKKEKMNLDSFFPQVIVIGSSTGGPSALEKVLESLRPPLKIPILIAQHMPPIFTASMAKRIQDKTGIECSEGADQEELKANKIYIAPGNYHMGVGKVGAAIKIFLNQDPPRNSVRPAVDNLFESAVKAFGSKCLGIILTGMGEDGLHGCRAVKDAGGGVLIQNKESCIVFGMPGAVFREDLQDEIGDLSRINQLLIHLSST
ncbi:MAG: chemotaxis-specific protein-glutamate methyltransferase CheB [Pseudobdellovibrionaceae bacterium]